MAIDVYSQVPSSNYENGYFQVGMFPSQVKVAGADIMADMAQQLLNLPTSAGTANAQTVTNTRQIASMVAGFQQWFLPGNTNTGATTLAVDGLSVVNLHAYGAALLGGELQTGIPALVKYDGSRFNLLNPQIVGGSFTGTATGMTTSPTQTINYRILNGSVVLAWMGASLSGTSNATTFTITGIPAAIQSSTAVNAQCCVQVQDAGANSIGTINTFDTNTWAVGKASGAFTSSGAKGLLPFSITYPL